MSAPRHATAWLCWVAVALAVVIGWLLREQINRSTPTWDPVSPIGVMKSDPALLYWFTEKIAWNGGSIPPDFAHCQAVQWPDLVDARVEFPMAQPWLAANLWRWLGESQPLHVFCATLFALLASLAAVAVFGLAFELTGRRGLALLATATWMLLPSSYRSAGFILLGEDVSFPAFVVHLWLVARAARMRTPVSFLLAGLALAVAMASWHAMGFFVAIEAGCFLAWYLRSGDNPFAARRAWFVLLPLVVACAVEPMLRGKVQILSLPLQIGFALIAMAWVERRRRLAAGTRLVATVVAMGVLLGIALGVSRLRGGGMSDYSHVFGLIAAKLRFGGELPRDPTVLPFEVRAMWQGPFDTVGERELRLNLNTTALGAAALMVLALPVWLRGRGSTTGAARGGARAPTRGGAGGGESERFRELERFRAAAAILALACAIALLASWLINRTLILAGFLFAVAAVVALREVTSRWWLCAATAVLLAPPLGLFPSFLHYQETLSWNEPGQREEIRALVTAIEEQVPKGAPVAADEVTATAILAATDRPMLVQPKYEWTAARQRLEEFRNVATRGTPQQLADFLRAHRCRHVAIDWLKLWGTRYQVGLADDIQVMSAETALAMITRDPEHVPGFKLLWKSPFAADRLRLLELSE